MIEPLDNSTVGGVKGNHDELAVRSGDSDSMVDRTEADLHGTASSQSEKETEGMNFGQWLKVLRTSVLGLKQDQFAAELGVSRSYIASMEIGLKIPSLQVLVQLRRRYGFSIDAMIDSLGSY